VTRAAGFLRQLAVFKKQTSALEPFTVNQVLRDLEPVLKRVAGDDIEFVLRRRLRSRSTSSRSASRESSSTSPATRVSGCRMAAG
jgi:hypothetical protein